MKFLKVILSTFLLSSCAHVNKNDPLENSRKLITQGHKTLYDNGAFQIPNTKIKLVPEGPGPISLATELAGVKARESFLLALKEAKDSVVIVTDGTKSSFKTAQKISDETDSLSKSIFKKGNDTGVWITSRSAALGKDIITKSWELPKEINQELMSIGDSIEKSSSESALAARANMKVAGPKLEKNIIHNSGEYETRSTQKSKTMTSEAVEKFVTAYLQLPSKTSQSFDDLKKKNSFENFTKTYKDTNSEREDSEKKMVFVMDGVVKNYNQDRKANFQKAKVELNEKADEVGYTLASLRALGWTLQGIFWDGLIKPAGKLAGASIGYLVINGVVYPAALTVRQGKNVGLMLAEVVKTTGQVGYDVVAPTGRAAFSLVIAGTTWSSGKIVKGAGIAAGKTVGSTIQVMGPVVEYSVVGAGMATQKVIQYVAIPIVDVATVTAGTLAGAVVGAQGVVTGGAVQLVGVTASGATSVVGYASSAATATIGTAGAVTHGAANVLYQVGKATVVPGSQVLTGGIVLSYGSLSQLGAHTVLAVSDAAYLVLSMEGPTYVVYAVQGKLGKGKNIPVGSVIDMESMQAGGEVIKKVPVSDEEMENLLKSLEGEYSQQ